MEIVLLSPDGIVFAATRGEWLYHSARPIAESRLQELRSSRQFSDYPLTPLPFLLDRGVLRLDNARISVDIQPVLIEGWQLATLVPMPFPWTTVVVLGSMAVGLGVLFAVIAFHTSKTAQLASEVRAGREASDRAEVARLASVRELETIFRTSLVGIVLVRDGHIANANLRMAEMFGYGGEEILGLDIRQFFQGRHAFRVFIDRNLRLLIDSDVQQVEYFMRRKDDAIIPCTEHELTNLDIALDAREMKPDIKIVMRMFDADLAARIEKGFGIHTAYSVSALAAPTIAAASLRVNVRSSFYIDDTLLNISEFSVNPDTAITEWTVGQLEERLNCSVVGYIENARTQLHPDPAQPLHPGSRLLVLADVKTLQRLEALNTPPTRR
jgi:PAS domain S-box-containing protein